MKNLRLPWFPLVLLGLVLLSFVQPRIKVSQSSSSSSPPPTPTPDLPLGRYEPPTVKPNQSYTIFLAGDSMTAVLGPDPPLLRRYLEADFPGKVFGLFNYSVGSSNIESLQKRLSEPTDNGSRLLPPILDAYFDVIIIESFGHNPLSNHPQQEGLIVQNQELEKNVKRLIATHPDSLIVFLATIPPSRTNYARGIVELNPEARSQWVDERLAYIRNHIKFAKDHNIPLINVYEKSLGRNGQVGEAYISNSDHIHPSSTGVELITGEIRTLLNLVLPK